MAHTTKSVVFDGSGDYVSYGTGFPDCDGAFSLSFWVKVVSFGLNNAVVWDTLTGQMGVRVDTSGRIGLFQGSGPGGFTFSGSPFPMTEDTWHHVLLVRTGSSGSWSIKCYLDGVQAADSPGSITDDPAGSPTSYRIGSAADLGGGHDMTGKITEVAIKTGADWSASAAGLADGSVDPISLTPTGLWYFDSNTTDSGSGGNNGTLTGNATYDADIPAQLAGGGGGSILPLVACGMDQMADMAGGMRG